MALFGLFKKYFSKEDIEELLDIADQGMLRDLELAKEIDQILLGLKSLRESKEKQKIESVLKKVWHTDKDIKTIKEFLKLVESNVKKLIKIMKVDVVANKEEDASLKKITEESKDKPELIELVKLCEKRLEYRQYIEKLIPPFNRTLKKLQNNLLSGEYLLNKFDHKQLRQDFEKQERYIRRLIELEITANKAADYIKGYSSHLEQYKEWIRSVDIADGSIKTEADHYKKRYSRKISYTFRKPLIENVFFRKALSQGEIKIHDPTTDKNVGTINFYKPFGTDVIEMHSLNVDPECRKLGLANQLISEVIYLVKKHKLTKVIVVRVYPENSNAIKIYKSFGFKFSGEKYGSGEVRMELIIGKSSQKAQD